MHKGRTALIVLMVLLAGCQRKPADVSTVPYRVVDEGRQRGDCTLCVLPLPDTRCGQGDGHAAEVRWHLPAAAAHTQLRMKAVRMDDDILDIPIAGRAGRATLPVELQPDDRIALVDTEASRELMFTTVTEPVGCALITARGQAPVGPDRP